jgi:hypothetical protein
MAENNNGKKPEDVDLDDLAEYESDEDNLAEAAGDNKPVDKPKDSYVGIHASGFREFLLKP